MHRIEPARLKPGATQDTLPGPRPSDAAAASDRAAPAIRGKALIFWDPKNPGRKLDAIDTDQITPAADCVSESLETLDERWKAGSFRHLMPDFRARVHRGENFLIAGERFAIGSSREMSPAGLKGVAEEKGLELVVVCSHGMGDIFRRNAFNLGLHVVQCPEAVEDAKDGDAFSFDPATRAPDQPDAGQELHARPPLAQGGGDPLERRHLRRRPARVPQLGQGPSRGAVAGARARAAHDDDRADRLGAPRGQGRRGAARRDPARVRGPAARLRRDRAVLDPHVQPDHRRKRDPSPPGRDRQRPLRVHGPRGRRPPDRDRPRVRPPPRIEEAVLRGSRATASSTSTFPSRAS